MRMNIMNNCHRPLSLVSMRKLLVSIIIFVVSIVNAYAGDARNAVKGNGYIRVDLVRNTIGDVKFQRPVDEIEETIGSNRITKTTECLEDNCEYAPQYEGPPIPR